MADVTGAVAWPVVVLIIVIAFFLSNRSSFWFENIVGRFRKIKAFDVELELSEKAALEVRELTQDAFAEWRKRVQTEFDRKIYASPVTESIRLVTEDVKSYLRGYKVRDLRATVHVPDPLFADMLYQLTDYYPAQKAGGGRGRIMSERFGIVGLAWRSRKTQVRHDVPTSQSELVEHWGMNLHEAGSAGSGRQSFFAHILKDKEHRAIGVFYMDVTDKDVFRKANTEATVALAVEQYGLAEAVRELSTELSKRGPLIKLTDLS